MQMLLWEFQIVTTASIYLFSLQGLLLDTNKEVLNYDVFLRIP